MGKRIGFVAIAFLLVVASGWTQTSKLFQVVTSGTPQDVQDAIAGGADVNARDKANMTPFMWAAENNRNPEVIMVLLSGGADAKIKDSEGMTALDYAENNSRLKGTDAMKQLEEASR